MASEKKDPAASKWQKGQTGNPNGRPRKDRDKISDPELRKMKKLLDKHTVEALQKIITIMQTATTPDLQIKTATLLIDRKLVVDKEIERREDRAEARGEGVEPPSEEKPKAPVFSLTMVKADGSAETLDVKVDRSSED